MSKDEYDSLLETAYLKRINLLIEDILRNDPLDGVRKPEPLQARYH